MIQDPPKFAQVLLEQLVGQLEGRGQAAVILWPDNRPDPNSAVYGNPSGMAGMIFSLLVAATAQEPEHAGCEGCEAAFQAMVEARIALDPANRWYCPEDPK